MDLDALRARFKGSYIGNNDHDLVLTVNLRLDGKVDAVAFGRPFITDPDLVHRLEVGAELAAASRETYYGNGAKGCIDRTALAD